MRSSLAIPTAPASQPAPAAPILAVDVYGAAHACSVSVSTIRRATASGELKCCRVGKSVRYSIAQLNEFLERSAVVAGGSPVLAD